jgi:2-dehydro-3-deoxyphosphogalactonate aldolase
MAECGADAVKIFPAEMATPAVVKALRAVLPAQLRLIPVGGIDSGNMTAYWQAGSNGFGLGSALYRPGDPADRVAQNAAVLVARMRELI